MDVCSSPIACNSNVYIHAPQSITAPQDFPEIFGTMGRDSKKQVDKCHCNKRVTKSESKPQWRGPGVAELERILGSQGHKLTKYSQYHHQESMPSFSAIQFPHSDYFGWHTANNEYLNVTRYEQRQEAIPDPNYGLSYTQMMTMDYDHPLFQLCMSSVLESHTAPTENSGFDHLTQYSLAERFYNISRLDKIQACKHEMKWHGLGTPSQFYTPLLGQSSMENDKDLDVYELQNILHRNAAESSRLHKKKSLDKRFLTFRPSGLSKKSSLLMKPIIIESDSSSEDQDPEEQYRGYQMQIYGFNLERNGLGKDEKKMNLNNINVPSTEHTLDLTLRL